LKTRTRSTRKTPQSQIANRKSKISVGPTRNGNGAIVAPNGNGKTPAPSSLMEAFEGARWGGYRGWWWFPTLDTSKQMPQWTRDQIARKQVWAYNNIPEMRAVIDGLAIDEVDTALWPKARTSNPKFNRAVTDRFDEENKDPRTFDLRQVESSYSAQFLIRRTVRLIGDMFAQLVRPFLPGAPPRMGFLPGYQCSSRGAQADDYDLREGIRFDPQTGAASKYRFALPVRKLGDKQEYTELEANDVLHFHDPFLSDQIRGISTLAPVTRQMFSMDDIDRAETSGQLLRSNMAFAIETQGPEESTIPRLPGVTDVEVVENPDGSKTVIQKMIQRDGTDVQVYIPPSGMKIKTLESNRGGAIEFRNLLARGMMHCTPYPPEWILSLMGLGQGTVARIVQNRVQKIANFYRAMQLDAQYMQRWYRYWLWQRIKAGVFDNVEGGVPFDWWVHKLVYPRDMSVDLGRDGRLYDDRVMRGNMSPADYHALAGRDEEDVDEEIVDIAIHRRKLLEEKLKENPGMKIGYEEVWRLPVGTANTAAAVESGIEPNAPSPGSTSGGSAAS
jgi:hypothetical protein